MSSLYVSVSSGKQNTDHTLETKEMLNHATETMQRVNVCWCAHNDNPTDPIWVYLRCDSEIRFCHFVGNEMGLSTSLDDLVPPISS